MNVTVKQKLHSETSGFENIGKFYKHIRSGSKENNLKPMDISIYMLLVEYSFGYMNNIQYEIQISISKIMEEVGTKTNKSVVISLQKLIDTNLIKRIRWQDVGPKQSYRYSVIFPKDFHIKIKDSDSLENKNQVTKQDIHDNLNDKINEMM